MGPSPSGEGQVVVAGRRGGGISCGVQHSHRGGSFFARGSHRRPSRAAAGFGRAQLSNIVDGTASRPGR